MIKPYTQYFTPQRSKGRRKSRKRLVGCLLYGHSPTPQPVFPAWRPPSRSRYKTPETKTQWLVSHKVYTNAINVKNFFLSKPLEWCIRMSTAPEQVPQGASGDQLRQSAVRCTTHERFNAGSTFNGLLQTQVLYLQVKSSAQNMMVTSLRQIFLF